MKALILKPSSLGDVVQALPVLRLIKRHIPYAEVYWWIESGLAGLLDEDPDLSGIVRFNRNGWSKPATWMRLWSDIMWMRNQHFDWVIDLQCLARTGSFAWLANGDLTVGLDEPREGAHCLYDRIVRRSRTTPHAVDWYLDVLHELGVPLQKFTWIPVKTAAARSIREKWPVDSRRWVMILPGARWPTKCWPAQYYSKVVKQLAATDKTIGFAILGTQQESEIAREISQSAPAQTLDLTGRLSLPEMIEWIRASELMIGNDTGPIHVAAALAKPVVAIYGPTDPERTGPYRQRSGVIRVNLPCSPCFRDKCTRAKTLECMHAITPQMVTNAALRHLSAH